MRERIREEEREYKDTCLDMTCCLHDCIKALRDYSEQESEFCIDLLHFGGMLFIQFEN